MATFNVVFEIEIEANTPLEAAKKVQDWLQNKKDNWQYYVQESDRKNAEILSVDLSDEAVFPEDNYKPLIKK